MSVRMRLTLWYTGILSATLLLLGMGLYFFLHYIYYDSIQSQLQQQAESVRTRIVPQFSLSEKGLTLEFRYSGSGRDLLRYNNMYFQVVNLQNGNKFYSPNVEEAGLKFPDIPAKQISCVLDGDCRFEKLKIDGLEFLVYYTPIISQRGEAIGMMQAGTYIEPYEQLLAMLRLILTVTALLSIVIASSVGWFLARKALRPIEQVIVATNQIEKGADLQKRIEYHGPNDEIGLLTQTINGMLSRLQSAYEELEEAYRAQRRFVSDASHELRTPLTTIRGNVELLEKMWKQTALQTGQQDGQQLELSIEAVKDISGEAERMSRLVGDLLSLARADAGFQMNKTEVEMRTLLDEVARKAQMLPRTADFIVGDLSAGEGVYVYGSPDYLQQLVFIFVENAFKYTEQGSVRLDAQRHKDQIGIRIADTGIGMDKEEVPHIFERFYRADPSRGQKSGTGLGLSIAKWIIDEHGGSVEVKTRKDEGTTFVIWLPIVPEGTAQASGHSLPSGNEV